MEQQEIAVIFDMDGVIIDSNPLITRAWKSFFTTHQIVLNDEQLNQYVFGRTAPETVVLVFPYKLTSEQVEAYADEVAGEVRRLYSQAGRIVPGFARLAKELHQQGIPIAIATSAPPANVEVVLALAGVTAYFSVVTDASQVSRPKPHPEIYQVTAGRLGIRPENCCVFEDSFSGIQAAKSAGMKVIGLATTHDSSELSVITDAVIRDFTSIDARHIRTFLEEK